MDDYSQWRESEAARLINSGRSDRDTVRELLVLSCHSSPLAAGFFAARTEDATLLDMLLDIAVDDYSGDAQMTASHWASQFSMDLLSARMPVLEVLAANEIDSIAVPAREALMAVQKARS